MKSGILSAAGALALLQCQGQVPAGSPQDWACVSVLDAVGRLEILPGPAAAVGADCVNLVGAGAPGAAPPPPRSVLSLPLEGAGRWPEPARGLPRVKPARRRSGKLPADVLVPGPGGLVQVPVLAQAEDPARNPWLPLPEALGPVRPLVLDCGGVLGTGGSGAVAWIGGRPLQPGGSCQGWTVGDVRDDGVILFRGPVRVWLPVGVEVTLREVGP